MFSKSLTYNLCLAFIFWFSTAHAQDNQKYKVVVGGFYNLENLFDTEDDTLINDEEFLPDGARAWTQQVYHEKLANMAYVISMIGLPDVPNGVAFLGVSEIENRGVLEALVEQPTIKGRHYEIIHYDSPDRRGVDVGFLYNPMLFKPLYSAALPLILWEPNGDRRYTRDVLYIKGMIEADTFHIFVNHWPSRGGGEALTAPGRNKGAALCKQAIDSIRTVDPHAKCIVMGDLNDDPNNDSLKKYLMTVSKIDDMRATTMFNPFDDMFRRGQGTTAYRDAWSLFDQIVVSEGLTDKKTPGFHFYKANIFNKAFLVQTTGKYKGYPKRTFDGDTYQGGYSDHFPTYIYLVKKSGVSP